MTQPRFRIAWFMIFIAILAADFAVMRVLIEINALVAGLLLAGALPMANVLMVGMLIGLQRPESSFLLGFETFGAMALALYVVLSFVSEGSVLTAYLLFVDKVLKAIGPGFLAGSIPIINLFVSVIMFGWPQVAFALIGGYLFRELGITMPPPE